MEGIGLTLVITGYPPTHINAVITHAIHFLGLLTFYLGVKLPFEISWSENKLGVGQPWIGAGPGSETGNWARYFGSVATFYVVHDLVSLGGLPNIPCTLHPRRFNHPLPERLSHLSNKPSQILTSRQAHLLKPHLRRPSRC